MEKNSKQIEDDEMPAQNIVRDKKKLLSTEVGSIVKANDNIDSKFLISPRGKDGKIVVQKNDFEVLLDRLAERDITLTKVLIPQSPFLPKVKDGVQKLANAIYNNNYITEIDLRMNKLRDAEMLILCPSFTSCSKLNNLNLEGNSIGSDGHEIIANMMENHPSLTTLKLTNQFYVTVSVEAERVLLNSLSQNTYLTKLGYAFERRDAFREREVVAQYLQRNQTAAKKNIAVHVPLEVPFPAVRNKQPVLIDILPNVVEVPETEGMSVAERKKLMAS